MSRFGADAGGRLMGPGKRQPTLYFIDMSSLFRPALIAGLALAIAGCKQPEMRFASESQPAIIGIGSDRGRQIADSVFWYTGVRADSIIGRDGMLRLVLPADALGRGVRMLDDSCVDRLPGLGAVLSLAGHAWSSRDASIVRDTIEVVFGQSIVEAKSASLVGSTVISCTAGPTTFHIAVSTLPTSGIR